MDGRTIRETKALVSTSWLSENLQRPKLRIFDCRFHLIYEEGTGRPYRQVSGRADRARRDANSQPRRQRRWRQTCAGCPRTCRKSIQPRLGQELRSAGMSPTWDYDGERWLEIT